MRKAPLQKIQHSPKEEERFQLFLSQLMLVFFIIDERRTGKDQGMRCRKDGLNEDRLRVGDYEIENWA